MCCQAGSEALRTPWYANVQKAARWSAEWLVGLLPCLKGHNRIHPAFDSDPDSLFVVLEAKKRIRVLHLYPDLGDAVLLSQIRSNSSDQTDSWDQKSAEGGEDYWFMRWNRPLRSNFQRNSCSCSFRKSNIEHVQETTREETLKVVNNGKNLAPLIRRKTDSSTKQDLNTCHEVQRDNVVECVSQNTVEGTVLENAEATVPSENLDLSVPSNSVEHIENSVNHCDIDVKEIKPNCKEYEKSDRGYVNPVFLASNDSLDCIPHLMSPNDSCDNPSKLKNDVHKTALAEESIISKEQHQDYNSNDSHQILEEMNARNKGDSVINEKSDKPDKIAEIGRKKHRKNCNVGSKAYLKKPVLFMIHGAGSSCEVWRGLIHHLVEAGYECVAPDILGHGLSSAPDSASCYTFHSLLQDLLGIFDRFVTEGRRSVVIGHGYGCSLAAAMTRYRAEQVIQLVLISGGGPTPLAPRTPSSVSPCMRCCLEPLLMCGFKRDVVYSVCGKQIEPCSPETCAVPRHILEHLAQGHIWPEGDAAFHRRIVSPTLIVHGMRDQHVTLVQQCEMERTIPRSFLEIIPEAGHWAMLETPDHLSHMVLCFIHWWAPTNHSH